MPPVRHSALPKVDFTITTHGPICLIEPVTDAARIWMHDQWGAGDAWMAVGLMALDQMLLDIMSDPNQPGLTVGNTMAGLH